jgi:D-lactate dehydrogenase (cytochrome)
MSCKDGNFHCILPVHPHDPPEYWDKLHAFQEALIQRTLAVGGTCTGEHGIGFGKMKYLERQYGPGAIHVMRAIKQALDPCGIMNPGKVVIVP